MFKKILPQETCFFDFFEKLAAKIAEGAKALYKLGSEGGDLEPQIKHIKDLEHEADEITHGCVDALHKTFITPISREEIHTLIKRMDDIIDGIDAASARMVLFEIKVLRPEVKGFADILVRASEDLIEAVRGLRDMKNGPKIVEKCIHLHHLENEGDVLLRSGLKSLFKDTPSAIDVIKWKEIIEILENATDRCQDVANIIEGIVIEAS
jgi:predicted phosphate transport protein (TIGR00153 family)